MLGAFPFDEAILWLSWMSVWNHIDPLEEYLPDPCCEWSICEAVMYSVLVVRSPHSV